MLSYICMNSKQCLNKIQNRTSMNINSIMINKSTLSPSFLYHTSDKSKQNRIESQGYIGRWGSAAEPETEQGVYINIRLICR